MRTSTERTSGGRRLAAAALVAGALVAATACSSTTGTDTAGAPPTTGSGGTSMPGTSPASPGTSAAPGTTTAPPASPEAVAANLLAADLGSGWADYPEGAEVLGDDDASGGCTTASGLVADLPDEDVADGAIIQYGDRLVFAQTNARVFPTPADAQAFAQYLLGDTYIECRRDQLERGLPTSEPPLTIASTGTYAGDGTTPYVGAFTYETQQLVDGVAQPAGASSRHAIYVKGATVIDLFSQLGYSPDDPADLAEVVGAMFDDGMAVVLARVDG